MQQMRCRPPDQWLTEKYKSIDALTALAAADGAEQSETETSPFAALACCEQQHRPTHRAWTHHMFI